MSLGCREAGQGLYCKTSKGCPEVHYTEGINVEELASRANLSKRQFHRIFKDLFNETPYEYIIKKRLNRACSMLTGTQASITEIAASCGFNDANYFSRLFKNRFSFTPLQYGKRFKMR